MLQTSPSVQALRSSHSSPLPGSYLQPPSPSQLSTVQGSPSEQSTVSSISPLQSSSTPLHISSPACETSGSIEAQSVASFSPSSSSSKSHRSPLPSWSKSSWSGLAQVGQLSTSLVTSSPSPSMLQSGAQVSTVSPDSMVHKPSPHPAAQSSGQPVSVSPKPQFPLPQNPQSTGQLTGVSMPSQTAFPHGATQS